MSDEDIETICIDLDSESDSNDRSGRRKSTKRYANRKYHKLVESDDEFTRQRVLKKNKRSADSDYEPSTKQAVKKRKSTPNSDDESSKKRIRKKVKVSISYHEQRNRKTDSKSECLDPDDERAQRVSVEVSQGTVPRKRMKVTAMREKVSVGEVDEADNSKMISNDGGSSLDSDTEKPKSSSMVSSKPSTPRKRVKQIAMRKKASVDEVDEAGDAENISNDSGSSLNSDTEKPKSSSMVSSKPSTPRKRMKQTAMRKKASNISNDSDSSIDSDTEKPNSSSMVSSKPSTPRKRMKQTAIRERPSVDKMDDADDCRNIPDEGCPSLDSNDADSVSDLLENRSDSEAENSSCSSGKVSTTRKMKISCENGTDAAVEAADDLISVPKKCGFELGYKAEKVIGITSAGPNGFKFLIQYRGREKAELVVNEKCRKYCPQLILNFYEEHIKWRMPE